MVQTNVSSSLNTTMQVGVLAVGATVGPIDAGGFRLAQTLAKSLTSPIELVTRALYPELTRLVAQNDVRRLRHVVVRICVVATGVATGALILSWTAAPLILRLIAGRQYEFARSFFVVLMLAGAVELAGFALEPFHNAHGRTGRVLRIRLVAAAVYIALLGALLPRFGGVGAAIASVGAAIAALVQFAASTRDILRPRAAPEVNDKQLGRKGVNN
jgi:O-antigen/teichoic acid export membrane protein